MSPPRSRDVASAVFACFGAGSLYGWSGYLPAVRAAFGLDYGGGSMVFSLAIASFTIGVMFGPRMAALHDRQLPVLTALAALCLVGATLSPTFVLFAMFYGVGFGASSGAIYALTLATAARSGRAALFVPVSVAAFGVGGALFGALSAMLGELRWGLWSTAPVVGSLLLSAVVLLVLADRTPMPATPGDDADPPPLAKGRDIARLWAIFACGSLAGLVVLGLAAQILAGTATDARYGTWAIVFAALGNTLGRLSAAPASRLYAPATGIAIAMGISCLALAMLLVSTSAAGVLLGLFLVALGYGHVASNVPLLVRRSASPADFARMFGWVFTGWGVAGLVGPWGAGILRDMTGTFTAVLLVCIGASVAGLTLALSAVVQSRHDTRVC